MAYQIGSMACSWPQGKNELGVHVLTEQVFQLERKGSPNTPVSACISFVPAHDKTYVCGIRLTEERDTIEAEMSIGTNPSPHILESTSLKQDPSWFHSEDTNLIKLRERKDGYIGSWIGGSGRGFNPIADTGQTSRELGFSGVMFRGGDTFRRAGS